MKLKEIRRHNSRPVRQARGLRLKCETRNIATDAPQILSAMTLLDSIPDDPRAYAIAP